MEHDVENVLDSGRVSVALRARESPNGHDPIIWIVEQRREVGREIGRILVGWMVITLLTFALGRLFFPGW
jgi:hypothetical protein